MLTDAIQFVAQNHDKKKNPSKLKKLIKAHFCVLVNFKPCFIKVLNSRKSVHPLQNWILGPTPRIVITLSKMLAVELVHLSDLISYSHYHHYILLLLFVQIFLYLFFCSIADSEAYSV